MSTHRGHVVASFKVHKHSKKFMGWIVKDSRLVRRAKGFFLHVTFRKAVGDLRVY